MTTVKNGSLYPVLSYNDLLAHPKRRLLLEKIKKNTYLDDENYALLYEPLIEYFIEFVQALPYHVGGMPGSLMDYSLERGELALRLFDEKFTENLDPLQAYALFSAALLQDVGRVMSQQKILFCDEQGGFIAEWLVCEGSMIGKTDYYRLRFLDQEWVGLAQAVTPILARQLMPPLGFTWLWDDHFTFRIWLAMLTGEGQVGGSLVELLQLVNAQLEAEHKKQALPPLGITVVEPEQGELGDDFLNWLKQQLSEGKLINQPASPMHILETGDLFMEWPQITKLFSESYGQNVAWQDVWKQFYNLGFTPISWENITFEQYFAKYPELVHREQATRAVSQHFMSQVKAQGIYEGTLQKIRQGTVIAQRQLAYLFGNNPIPSKSIVNLQPVNAQLSQKQKSLDRLLILQKQQNRQKSMGYGR